MDAQIADGDLPLYQLISKPERLQHNAPAGDYRLADVDGYAKLVQTRR